MLELCTRRQISLSAFQLLLTRSCELVALAVPLKVLDPRAGVLYPEKFLAEGLDPREYAAVSGRLVFRCFEIRGDNS